MEPKRVNYSKMKLGKKPVRHDDRTFQLATYLNKEKLISIPDKWNWGSKVEPTKWGMMRNRHIENCTCVTAGHFIMAWTSNTGRFFKPRDKAIVATYITLTNYDPVTDANDIGVYSIDLLKYWRKNEIDGHKILAFAAVNFHDHEEVKEAIYLFGGCFAGIGLPISCQKQHIWDVPPEGETGDAAHGSWGGHAVLITGYNEYGLKCVTWGKEKKMTWAFWDAYCEEAYAVFSEDFIKDDKTPTGIDIRSLQNALAELKRKK